VETGGTLGGALGAGCAEGEGKKSGSESEPLDGTSKPMRGCCWCGVALGVLAESLSDGVVALGLKDGNGRRGAGLGLARGE
jgi:hypothetical protein